jgi:hypothetical protein
MLKTAYGYVPFVPNNIDCRQKVSDRLFYAFYFRYLPTFISFSFTIKKSVILFKSNTTIILIVITRNERSWWKTAKRKTAKKIAKEKITEKEKREKENSEKENSE